MISFIHNCKQYHLMLEKERIVMLLIKESPFFCHSSCLGYVEAKHLWQPPCSPAPSFCFCYVSCRRAPLTPLPGIEPLWEGTDGNRLRPPPSSHQWVPVPWAAERALAWPHVPCALHTGKAVVADNPEKLLQPFFFFFFFLHYCLCHLHPYTRLALSSILSLSVSAVESCMSSRRRCLVLELPCNKIVGKACNSACLFLCNERKNASI